jgi:proteasome lid subunit RPN8/RPN11
MNVKIDSDVLESILKAHARRQKHQIRIYGVIIGTQESKDSFNIKNCIISYIYEEAGAGGSTKVILTYSVCKT